MSPYRKPVRRPRLSLKKAHDHNLVYAPTPAFAHTSTHRQTQTQTAMAARSTRSLHFGLSRSPACSNPQLARKRGGRNAKVVVGS